MEHLTFKHLFQIKTFESYVPFIYSINPICPGIFLRDHALRKYWWENAFDLKLSTVILCNVTKKIVEKKFQNCWYMIVIFESVEDL